jgi:hypothetical protein
MGKMQCMGGRREFSFCAIVSSEYAMNNILHDIHTKFGVHNNITAFLYFHLHTRRGFC